MRHTLWLVAVCSLLLCGLAQADFTTVGVVSPQTVWGPRLTRTMPGQLVTQGMLDSKLFQASSRDGGKTWTSFNLDLPTKTWKPFAAESQVICWVGTSVNDLVLGGEDSVKGRLGVMPVWYRSGGSWRQASLSSTPNPQDFSRCVNSLTYGNQSGTLLYAFGYATVETPRFDRECPAVWKSSDRGIHWTQLLTGDLRAEMADPGDKSRASFEALSPGLAVWGRTNQSLIRLMPNGQCTVVKQGPFGARAICAPSDMELVRVTHGILASGWRAGITYSPNGGFIWSESGGRNMTGGFLTSAEFLNRNLGVLALVAGKGSPQAGTWLYITRDGGKTWTNEVLKGSFVESVRIVSPTEIYLLADAATGGRVSYLKWTAP
jgi:hypothetical protein